ncbi:methionyl-tRNA formyltransferase [Leucobacter chinensis]|uniref:methionyl-tRNA formyltransferase n=1 Tax=Leucobacter chinensis TaxID=2851010 RepID=UPI001C232E41|nr:methionyl-tRNA formyltransferase [Leucobacter chinensis]
MRVVFAGTPEVATSALNQLVASRHEVVGVITREDAPLGRKRVLTPSPVATLADEHGIPVVKANRLTEEVTEWVRERNADLGVVVAYGGLLKSALLETPRLGWVNLHFSSLPRWRGAAPVQRALMNGEQELGLSVFRLVEALDAGDIVANATVRFEPGTTAGAALEALAVEGGPLILQALETLETNPEAGTAQAGEVNYAHKLERGDGKLDPTESVESFMAHWAGVTPEPGAFVLADGEPVKLHEIRAGETEAPLVAGTARIVGKRALLGTASGPVELVRVQPAGKGAMDGAAWLRGRGGEQVIS